MAQASGVVDGVVAKERSVTVANGDSVKVIGVYQIRLTVMQRPYAGPFLVLANSNPNCPVILGMKAIRTLNLRLDVQTNVVSAVSSEEKKIAISVAQRAKAEPYRHARVTMLASLGGRPVRNETIAACINWQDVVVETNDDGQFTVLMANRTGETTTWERKHHMGAAEPWHDYQAVAAADAADLQISAMDAVQHVATRRGRRAAGSANAVAPPSVLQDIQKAVAHLPQQLRQPAAFLLARNWSCISKDKFDIGLCKLYSHKISLHDPHPTFHRQFPIPLAHQQTILESVENWLKLGIVEPAKSQYNSPIFCVRKKGGGFRMCLDYRGVNSKSLPENYNIRTPEDCMAEVGQNGGKYFIALDLSSGFYQMEMDKASRPVTAFTVPRYGQLQWTRGAMGLKGCPASFARMMDMVVKDIPKTITYIDDLLIYDETPAGALKTLEAVLARFRQHNLKINLAKSSILQPITEYLGHTLSQNGISPGKEKASAITNAQPPHTVKQLKSFLGLVNYFRSIHSSLRSHSRQTLCPDSERQLLERGPPPPLCPPHLHANSGRNCKNGSPKLPPPGWQIPPIRRWVPGG